MNVPHNLAYIVDVTRRERIERRALERIGWFVFADVLEEPQDYNEARSVLRCLVRRGKLRVQRKRMNFYEVVR